MSRPRRRGRDIHGVLLLDKASGASSNDVLQKVKRLYQANKAGHTGALDPLATGMLPICLGEATKFSQYLLDADKRYRVVACLGQRTDTSDADGNVVEQRDVNFNQQQLEVALEHFRGETQQVPTMFSALKYQGRPLYEYARQGITVPREPRRIEVFELKLIGWQDQALELEIHCSKGTYIRTIIDDLGEMLGCGAHVTLLRRLQVANYPQQQMVTLQQLQDWVVQAEQSGTDCLDKLDALLLPMDSPAAGYPIVNMPDSAAHWFCQGQAVLVAQAPTSGLVRVTQGVQQKFIGMGMIDQQGRVAPKRVVVDFSQLA